MAKFHGKVGYGTAVENPQAPGVHEDRITTVTYTGDVVRNSVRPGPGESLNGDISVGHSISIIADGYAIEHFMKIKYVEWAGVNWTVTDVEIQRPRLILNLGSVYNGPTP
jgi:hypothetical protein